MSILRPMTDTEFEIWKQETIPRYAHEKVVSGEWVETEAIAKSREVLASLLPDGKKTKDHYLFAVLGVDEMQVGVLWFAVQERIDARIAYLYNIEISLEHQRKGYAKRALCALEDECKKLALGGIALHVFGNNTDAQCLYTKLGYLPTNIHMFKSFSSPDEAVARIEN